MGVIRTGFGRRLRARIALLGVLSLVSSLGLLTLAGPAAAATFTGGFSPNIIGGLADLNGDGVVNGKDDANAFYGSTHIIDGKLDCDAWAGTTNAGTVGNGTITAADDCTLLGYDGTSDGVTIQVENGVFDWNGRLPTVFPQTTTPNNPDVSESKFAWSTINGRVDSSGNEAIGADDCHFGLIGETDTTGPNGVGGADILGSDPGCGFATPPPAVLNGFVDLNSDETITAADTCTNNCFFGHDVDNGLVQEGAVPPTFPGPPPAPPGPPAQGYWLAAADGGVFAFNVPFEGSMGGTRLNSPVVGIDSDQDADGYYLFAADGGVFAFDADFHGSMGGTRLNSPVVGGSTDPDGDGYYLWAADGGVFAFDASFHGSMGGTRLNSPVVGGAADPDGGGYYLFAADGGVFAFDADFHGSMGAVRLNSPVVGGDNGASSGYWMAAADGGVFAFNEAFRGSMGGTRLNSPVVGMSATSTDNGYWLGAADGGVFAFDDATFHGSMGGTRLNSPVVGIEGFPGT